MQSPGQRKVVVWGAGGHALVVADILRLVGEYEVAGFLDDVNEAREAKGFFGAPVFYGRAELPRLKGMGVGHVIFGFGDCAARLRLAGEVRAMGLSLARAIHPKAVVAVDVPVGVGTVIAAGAVVNPGSFVGENVNVAPLASVDHECVIEDGAHLSPGVHLSGKASIGRGAWIGIGALIGDNVRVGADSLVGAGALVLGDVPERSLVYGSPARVIKTLSDSPFREIQRSREKRLA
jgi:acetyltransferase EpsM